ncbi:M23 family metallopeptidase [Dasania marina]|uniref:M23 family metallopeptidase n=1 Tax=Dasania marina TaxID=471499 RepID=UPI0006879047|nr:M23 family metallopeptidase [Dasania marina]
MYKVFLLLWMFSPWLCADELAIAGITLKGPFTQGGLVIGHGQPGTEISLDGQKVSVSEQGLFSLGFDRDAPATMPLSLNLPDGSQFDHKLSIARREYQMQRIEGIAKKIMSPSPQALKRIRADSLQVRQARAEIQKREDFAGPFVWPLTGPITGVFGSQRVYNGEPKRPHYGVDVAAPTGTPLSTPAPGVVTLAHDDMFYSGGTLIIDHGYGVSSTLMHLSKVLVNVGDEVKPGDIVAEVGATGRATGPHLDWRMNWYQSRIDPQLLVAPMAANPQPLH